MNLKKYIALVLVFALGFTIARPYFIEHSKTSIQNNSSVNKKEKGGIFSKLVWQLENSNELEEDAGDDDNNSKALSYQSTYLNTPFSYQFNKSNTTQLTLLLNSRKQLTKFSKLFILFENLRN